MVEILAGVFCFHTGKMECIDMNASEIKSIISEFHQLPYKSVLISGAWGIGKSYAVENALPDDSCMISLFGIKKAEDIYHDLFFRMFGKSKEKMTAVASKIFDGAVSVLGEFFSAAKAVGEIKDALTSIVAEKDLLFQGLKKLDTPYIIAFDDLERLPDNIDISEVFGIIEELKKYEHLKVIIVANLNEMRVHKNTFESYSEKVIDRVYKITEPSFDVNWDELGIDSMFAKEFMSRHKVKNLRTMKKAQDFYEDVRINGGIDNEKFLYAVQHLCYGVVVEIIDELYKENMSEAEAKTMSRMELGLAKVRALLPSRISMNYLTGVWCSSSLMSMIEKYYSESGVFDKEQYRAEYEVFLKAGEVNNFYKTEMEIRDVVSHWKEWFVAAKNARELSRFAEEAVGWTELLKEPTEEIIYEFKKRLAEMLWNIAIQKGTSIFTLDDYSYHTNYGVVSEATHEVVKSLREKIVLKYIDDLVDSMNGRRAFEVSYQLRQCYQNTYYSEIVKVNSAKLLRRESFPIDEMTEEKYHTCYNVLYILRKTDQNSYDQFVEELLEQCDKMAAHRIKIINRDIDEK